MGSHKRQPRSRRPVPAHRLGRRTTDERQTRVTTVLTVALWTFAAIGVLTTGAALIGAALNSRTKRRAKAKVPDPAKDADAFFAWLEVEMLKRRLQ